LDPRIQKPEPEEVYKLLRSEELFETDKKELKKMVQEEEQELEELLMSHGSSVVGRISVDR